MNAADKKRRWSGMSLSTTVLIGLALGILTGIFLGEYAANLQVIGDVFIRLLQMSVLPYVTLSLIAGLGSLSYKEARLLAIKGGFILLVLWSIAFLIIFLMPLAFPPWKAASFFSTAVIEPRKEIDFLSLYIPANPFNSMANSVIPAVVLFSIALGVALIGVPNKAGLIKGFHALSSALTRVAKFVVKLSPIGVFAIAASAAGTMTIEEFERLEIYFITYISTTLLLTFWILPTLITTLTPLKYKDVMNLSKDALVTGFATDNLFIILPILVERSKELLQKYRLVREDTDALVDVIIPVSFNFPNIGRMLSLLFILFTAWFTGNFLELSEYPGFIVLGLVSFFGTSKVAVPFLLDLFHLPADMFQLFIATDVITGRFSILVGVMNLLVFSLVGTCAITGSLTINWTTLARYLAVTVLLTAAVIIGLRIFFSQYAQISYKKDEVIASMHLLKEPAPSIVHREIPPVTETTKTDNTSTLDTIKERGVLKVGYQGDYLPLSFFNASGDLVGFDVELAHKLARELGVRLEFVPFQWGEVAAHLDADHFDIAMTGLIYTTERIADMDFAEPHMELTLAFIVEDYRRNEFSKWETFKNLEGLTIGVVAQTEEARRLLERVFPDVEVVLLGSLRDFFEGKLPHVDAVLTGAEIGSAWTLLYPDYQVAIPLPAIIKYPLAYTVKKGDRDLVKFLSDWLRLKKSDKTIEGVYNHWILGQGARQKEPRWSVIRDVLHWVD
jgi:Na+/H+-dicarboxylate symporter/ABC-type amino acid transport substrate-binding protein